MNWCAGVPVPDCLNGGGHPTNTGARGAPTVPEFIQLELRKAAQRTVDELRDTIGRLVDACTPRSAPTTSPPVATMRTDQIVLLVDESLVASWVGLELDHNLLA
jgi:hypothetical protein